MIKARHLAGDAQAADLLTKPLDRKRFATLRAYLMNSDAQVSVGKGDGKTEDGLMSSGPRSSNETKSSLGSSCASSSSAGRR